MASFEDRVRNIIEPDLEDIRNLFLDDFQDRRDADYVQPDLSPILDKLDKVLTWNKNIKSEVRQIYVRKPDEKDDNKDQLPEKTSEQLPDNADPVKDTRGYKDLKYTFDTLTDLMGVPETIATSIWDTLYKWAKKARDSWDSKFHDYDHGNFAPEVETNYSAEMAPIDDEYYLLEHIRDDIRFLLKCCHELRRQVITVQDPPDSKLQTQILLLRRYPMRYLSR